LKIAAIIVGFVLALCIAPFNHAAARETTLVKATDLQADAKISARDRIPIIILFSLAGCPHCEVIRQSHLTPLARTNNKKMPNAIVRQVDLGSPKTMIDFAGVKTTHQEFVNAQQVKFSPVVIFYDASGKKLGDPLIGAMLPDFYGAYLDDALAAATSAINPDKPAAQSK
jgi:thioredoxin-related protein